jgi:superfamily II DNA/RNA helicase
MLFNELGLSEKVLSAVTTAGYTVPTPIQEQAIPVVLQRRDVLGIAQTGTGKTAAFTLPMLTLLENGRARARMPRTLILEPTRELAAQVEENFTRYGVNQKLSVALLIGGVSFGDQDAKITRGVDVLIATPGRLLDHVERGKLLLNGVELLVIDEADRMLDMGFIPDIERVCKLVPFTRQTLFFTATMPPEITRITEQFLHNPVRIEVSRPASTAATITQRLVASRREDFEKRETLRGLIKTVSDLQNAIVFCNRKLEVAALHKSLVRHGFPAVALHGDMDQHARMKALDQFRNGEMKILVASDVAARGLDIPEVSHVFNYDVPHHAEDYVHRIGRTGRAGRAGAAFTIVTRSDEKSVAAIEKLIGQQIAWDGTPAAEINDESPDGAKRRGSREVAGAKSGRRERSGLRRGRPERDNAAEPAIVNADDTSVIADPAMGTAGRVAISRHPHDRMTDDQKPGAKREKSTRQPGQPRSSQRPPVARPSDDEQENRVVGLGDHVPAFLMRSTR